MLDKHLIPRTKPTAKKSQIYIDSRVRITVLTPRLIRVESGGFTDSPSQIVWFRDLEKCVFDAASCGSGVTIVTKEAEFFYSYLLKRVTSVTFKDGTQVKTANIRPYNLKGTVRSLDNTFGNVPLGQGIVSRCGVAIMEDDSLLLCPSGMLLNRKTGSKDKYVFAHGLDYRAALGDFYKITGEVPLIPRAALGNWWSRWKAYTQEEYIALMQRFKNENIPFAVATIDMDWHMVDIKRKFPEFKTEEKGLVQRLFWGDGWTGYTWEKELFPDHKAFLKWLHDNGMETILNLHPSSGVRWFEEKYKEMAYAMGVDPETKQTIKFDMSSPHFINAYFRILHRPLEEEGVDWWWVDWQQGRKSQQKKLDPLWALNHYHSLEAARNDAKRPLILSRFSGPGSHRYPIGFSGDTMARWSALRFQPYFTATAANIGYTWWSHDIGGHWGGIKNDELYLRWLQFGVYSPINRLHSVRHDLMGKEIWNYRPDVEHYAKRLLIRRHRFIPYNYTMNHRTHTQGIPICEPLYYQYPHDAQAYKYKNQYFFGSELMVCPITQKSSSNMALSTIKVWLPKGRWTDINTDRVYQGGREITLAREIHEIPVFAREGAIVPNAAEEEIFNTGLPKSMDLYVYRGNNKFDLYEDNGTDMSYKNGEFATTTFEVNEKEDKLVFTINPAKGTVKGKKLLPKKRKYRIIFKDINDAGFVGVRVNGKVKKTKVRMSPLTLTIDNITPSTKVEIFIDKLVVRGNRPFTDEVIRLFSRLSMGNLRKKYKFRRVKNFLDDKPRFARRLRFVGLPKALKIALRELVEMEN